MTRHARLTALVATVALGLFCRSSARPRAQEVAGPGPIASIAWLAAHLGDPTVAVVATGGDEADFERAHIPGARFVPHGATLGPDHGPPSPAAFADDMTAAGATDRTVIVLYGPEPMSLGWLYMNVAATGHAARVSVLDGNVEAWRAAGHTVATGPAAAPTSWGRYTVSSDPSVAVDAVWVRAHLDDASVRLLDVRSEREWKGGTIPGAAPVLWQDLYADLDAGRFKDEAELRNVFARAGLSDGQTVVTYCAVGMRASLMYFVARALNLPARVYVGSWSDWRGRPGYPIDRRPR